MHDPYCRWVMELNGARGSVEQHNHQPGPGDRSVGRINPVRPGLALVASPLSPSDLSESQDLAQPAPCPLSLAQVVVLGHDDDWSGVVSDVLSADGFAVEAHKSIDVVLSPGALFRPDVVAVDLQSLPHGSGVAVCAALRALATVGVAAIGRRASDDVVVSALNAGADTFVARDASPRELVARVRALLRRIPPAPPTPDDGLAYRPLDLDPARRTAVVAGQEVGLTLPEFAILEALVRTPGRAVSRKELTEVSGGSPATSSLDRHIRRLRHKLESKEGVRCITAVRGMGFRYDPTVTTTGDEATGLNSPPEEPDQR